MSKITDVKRFGNKIDDDIYYKYEITFGDSKEILCFKNSKKVDNLDGITLLPLYFDYTHFHEIAQGYSRLNEVKEYFIKEMSNMTTYRKQIRWDVTILIKCGKHFNVIFYYDSNNQLKSVIRFYGENIEEDFVRNELIGYDREGTLEHYNSYRIKNSVRDKLLHKINKIVDEEKEFIVHNGLIFSGKKDDENNAVSSFEDVDILGKFKSEFTDYGRIAFSDNSFISSLIDRIVHDFLSIKK